MKKINKKGFTLIELLAVIVILAILIAVAVPAITRYLASARANTFKDNALSALDTVRKDKIINGGTTTKYDLTAINKLLDKKLSNSPYGNPYTGACVTITSNTDGADTYSICLTDGHFGIDDTEENIIAGTKGTGEQKKEVKVDNTVTECTCTNN